MNTPAGSARGKAQWIFTLVPVTHTICNASSGFLRYSKYIFLIDWLIGQPFLHKAQAMLGTELLVQ